MDKILESWSVGNGDVAVYTEDPEAARTLEQLIGRGAIYEKAGRVFGWQSILPKTKRRFVEVQISRKFSVDSKRVAGRTRTDFDIRDLESPRVDG